MPLLGVDQRLVDSTLIKTVVPLADARPIYLLVGTDESQVVIKKELTFNHHDKDNLHYANLAMHRVSPAFLAEVCLPFEVEVLRSFVDMYISIADMTFTLVPAEIDHLDNALQSGGAWFKMSKAEEVRDLSEAMKQLSDHNDKSGVRQIAAALRRGGLEALGKIIAADLFNGNVDRFNPYFTNRFGQEKRVGDRIPGPPPQQQFAVLLNIGNVLFSMRQNESRPIGLDPYDRQGHWRKMNKTIRRLESTSPGGEDWPGHHLKNIPQETQWRARFATLIAEDLETALGPRNRKIAVLSSRRLPRNADARILTGMNTGINDLKNTFNRSRLGPIPAGLRDRLHILGW